MLRLIIALFIAPLLCWFVRDAFLAYPHGPTEISELVLNAFRASVLIYLFALPVGVALLAVCWRLGLLSWPWAVLVGAVIALLFFSPMTIDTIANGKLNDWYRREVLMSTFREVFFGGVVGLAVWLFGIWRNPALWVKVPRKPSQLQNAP